MDKDLKLGKPAKKHIIHEDFNFRDFRHLAIVTVASIPLTTILIVIFLVLFAKLQA